MNGFVALLFVVFLCCAGLLVYTNERRAPVAYALLGGGGLVVTGIALTGLLYQLAGGR